MVKNYLAKQDENNDGLTEMNWLTAVVTHCCHPLRLQVKNP
jgi:hypothetical protein